MECPSIPQYRDFVELKTAYGTPRPLLLVEAEAHHSGARILTLSRSRHSWPGPGRVNVLNTNRTKNAGGHSRLPCAHACGRLFGDFPKHLKDDMNSQCLE